MFSIVLQRKQYGYWVATLFVLKIILVVSVVALPNLFHMYKYADTAIFIMLAIAVGARFADIGWPRWLGFLAVFILMIVVPVAFLFATHGFKLPRSERPFDLVPDIQWIGTLVLVAFLIFVGFKKSHPDSEGYIKGPPAIEDRIEPKIM